MYPELYSQSSKAGQEVNEFGRKWGWYNSIYGIAKGNVFDFERVTKMRLHEALLFMSYEAEKNRIETNLIKKKK